MEDYFYCEINMKCTRRIHFTLLSPRIKASKLLSSYLRNVCLSYKKLTIRWCLKKKLNFCLTTLHVTEMRPLPTEDRKRGADNSFQFDRIMKSSKPLSPTVPKLLNGTAYLKQKGYFEQDSIDIGSRNNCPKSSIPILTIFYVMNLRQTQTMLKRMY